MDGLRIPRNWTQDNTGLSEGERWGVAPQKCQKNVWEVIIYLGVGRGGAPLNYRAYVCALFLPPLASVDTEPSPMQPPISQEVVPKPQYSS